MPPVAKIKGLSAPLVKHLHAAEGGVNTARGASRWNPRLIAPRSMAWADFERRRRVEHAGVAAVAPPVYAAEPPPFVAPPPADETLLAKLSRHLTGQSGLSLEPEAAPQPCLDMSGQFRLVSCTGLEGNSPDEYLKTLGVSYVARSLCSAAEYGVGRQRIQWRLEPEAVVEAGAPRERCMHVTTQVAIPIFALKNAAAMRLDGGRFDCGDSLTGVFPARCTVANEEELAFSMRGMSGYDLTLRYTMRGADEVVQTSHTLVNGRRVGTRRVFRRCEEGEASDPDGLGRAAACEPLALAARGSGALADGLRPGS